MSGRSSSALAVNSEQSSGVQLTCRYGLDVSRDSSTSASLRTSRNNAPGASAADFTWSTVLKDDMVFPIKASGGSKSKL